MDELCSMGTDFSREGRRIGLLLNLSVINTPSSWENVGGVFSPKIMLQQYGAR